ncbi:MAG: tetratricopeptide repeat protein [Planctomycetota bacterium]|jgi:tetratricopeptide (TPR) repeat protein
MLLIWDNFETVRSMPDPARATPPLEGDDLEAMKAFLLAANRSAPGAIIITSRSREDWLGPKVGRIPLAGLSAHEAAEYADELLSARPAAQARRGDRAYGELIGTLDGHPLSMRLILPHLDTCAAADLLAGLRGQGDLPPGFEGGEGRLDSLGASVHYSFRALPADYQRRLPALALFEGVADLNVLGVLSADEDAPGRFRGVSKDEWEKMLSACAETGLVAEMHLRGTYRMHPALPAYLVALWRQEASAAFEAELEAARLASICAYASLGAWLDGQIEGGKAETAMAVLDLERRSLGAALGAALDGQFFAEAQAILQPLNDHWDARGLYAEATRWVDRVRIATEAAAGGPPDLDTPPGALWLFAVASEANRLIGAGDLDGAERAHDAIRATLETAESPTGRRRLAASYHQLGRVAGDRGDLAAAEQWYGKSLAIKEALGNRPGMASSYHELGNVAYLRGDLQAAEQWYRKSLEIDESLRDRPHMAATYHQIGMVAQRRGDLQAAEQWYRRSLEIEKELGNRPGMATSYHQLGIVAQRGGDLEAADQWYRRSLKIREALDNRPDMASSYHQLGNVAYLRSNLQAAEQWYRKSLEINEALGNRPAMAGTYHDLGNVEYLRGDLRAAEQWYRKSLDISEDQGNRPYMALTFAQMGLLAEKRADGEQALDWMVRCVSLFGEFPHPSTVPGPEHLARLTGQLGMGALEAAWRKCTDNPLPDNVRRYVRDQLR